MRDLLIIAQEGAHEIHAGDGGWWADTAGIMLVLPLVAFLLILPFGKRMKYNGAEIAIGALAINTVWASVLLYLNATEGVISKTTFVIARIGSGLVFELGWVVDGLSIIMYFLVSLVGLLVFIYAVGYMHGDRRVDWFFAAFSLFAGAMLVLVGAPNLVQMIIGWEGVGLASYLLIGFYWEDIANVKAGNKAFLTNKVADVGLVLGAVIIGLAVGTWDFFAINEAAVAGDEALAAVAVVGGALLFFGAMGKSAQFPLHIWLPDAMAGPTPVSALMHAATMVTAGIYLMARMFPLYETLAQSVRPAMIAIGAVTLFGVGLLALVAKDIKKVLAYSTVSQLGYMMTVIAAGGYTAAMFHLFTHAFFKALLFLGAGSVIHAVHSNYMSDMGGLRKFMPYTYWTFIIGSLALAGVGLSGFWSKDEILVTLGEEGYQMVMWLAIGGAFVTAFYMARVVALTFHGTYKGHGEPHESPRIMTVPLIILAIPAAIAGLINIPGVTWPSIGNFTEWLSVRVISPMGDFHPETVDWLIAGVGLLAALAGVVVGWIIYSKDRLTQADRDDFEIPVLYTVFRHGYWVDDAAYGVVGATTGPIARFVDWTNTYVIDAVVNGVAFLTMKFGSVVYDSVDQKGVDGVVHGLSAAADGAGSALRKMQTGRVQQYAASFVGGALILVLVFVFLI